MNTTPATSTRTQAHPAVTEAYLDYLFWSTESNYEADRLRARGDNPHSQLTGYYDGRADQARTQAFNLARRAARA
ncbi:MAG: hypothetical protein WCF36_19025 [Candidatus Nanopelagicales bacterium]